MRHVQGDIISPHDCVLLKSGPRRTDLPFVAKVAAMWENPEDGKCCISPCYNLCVYRVGCKLVDKEVFF